MHGQADQARLLHHRTFHRLANPPRRVGRKAKTALGLELGDGVHQAEVAFFDQVAHRQPAPGVVLGDAHHQAQVALDHALARCKVTGPGQHRGVMFFQRAEQGRAPNIAQVAAQRIAVFRCVDAAVGRSDLKSVGTVQRQIGGWRIHCASRSARWRTGCSGDTALYHALRTGWERVNAPAGAARDRSACPGGESRSATAPDRCRCCPSRQSSGPGAPPGLPSPARPGCGRRP